MAELIGGSGYDDVQDTEPSNPSIGDTWLDTSDGDAAGKIYADLGNGADWQVLPVQDELQNGRTRELLMLLQDKPVPEVQDPINQQSSLSKYVEKVSGDYQISDGITIEDMEDGDTNIANADYDGWIKDSLADSFAAVSSSALAGQYSLLMKNTASGNSNGEYSASRTSTKQINGLELLIQLQNVDTDSYNYADVRLQDGNQTTFVSFFLRDDPDGTIDVNGTTDTGYSDGVTYKIRIFNIDYSAEMFDYELVKNSDGTVVSSASGIGFNNSVSSFRDLELKQSVSNGEMYGYYDDIRVNANLLSAFVTDRFASPTTAPADFKQWRAIQARDVTTGGSTSPEPVAFEILDSTDTVLNSSRIPKERIADEAFTMRNRVYSEDAGIDGQSDYQIDTTGDGGHFGIPILTVVSVKKNDSVLDSANWSFDPDTNTVTIDTSNVSLASGDTIDIKYDFDVFDSTLQPRAYLSRESLRETSPSISHFRYEYII